MITATETMIKEREGGNLNRQIEEFLHIYSSQFEYPYAFERDLISLIRAIHRDAAKPYEASMLQMMNALPLAFTFKKDAL